MPFNDVWEIGSSCCSYSSLLDHEVDMAFGARTADKYMLEGRRAEKDFLARKDMKYLSKHKGIVDKIIVAIEGVGEKAELEGYDSIVEQSAVIKKQALHYHKIFETSLQLIKRLV